MPWEMKGLQHRAASTVTGEQPGGTTMEDKLRRFRRADEPTPRKRTAAPGTQFRVAPRAPSRATRDRRRRSCRRLRA
jgi:hypothetical protein